MKLIPQVLGIITHPDHIPGYWKRLLREWKLFNFDYAVLNGYSFSPKSLCLILTEQCNLRCIMCDIGQRNAQRALHQQYPLTEAIGRGEEVMELDDWKKLVDDIARKRWNTLLLLTGTEPLLSSHLMPLVNHIVENNLRVHITTNGTLVSHYADQLVDVCKKPDSLSLTISLDGIGEIHDAIRGVPGTFARAIEGLRAITRHKKARGTPWPSVTITYTISPANYRHMREFVQWFHHEDMAIESITFSHLWFKDEAIVKEHNLRYSETLRVREENLHGIALSEIDMEYVYNELREIRTLFAESPFYILEYPQLRYEEAMKYYAKTTEKVFYHKCLAPWRNVAVTPKGEVIVSPMCFNYPLGNVKKTSFIRIWNDLPMRTFRQGLQRVGIYPACVRCCLLFDSKPKFYKLKQRLPW